MTWSHRIAIDAEASAALLCRVLALFAQRDLAVPQTRVLADGNAMTITLDISGVDLPVVALVAEKIARLVGIEAIVVDDVALADCSPSTLLAG